MRRQILAVMVVLLWPCLARGEPTQFSCPQFPDTKNWTVVNKSRIEVRVSQSVVVYLGLDIEYQNPVDTAEFTRVISRHIPLVISTRVQQDQRSARDLSTTLYNQKEEQERLKKLESETDPVLYIQWRTTQFDREFLNGDISIWLISPDGGCYFTKNKQVQVEFLSENVGNGKPRNVLVGRKYEVDGRYHIIKADRNDIKNLVEGGK